MTPARNDDIAARWVAVRERVNAACTAANRDPSTVTVVAVSKTHPASAVRAAALAGAIDFGENYAQELVEKRTELEHARQASQDPLVKAIRWHFIGRLQRNKAKLVAGNVALIHAVDSIDLATELAKRAAAVNEIQPVLISVNVAGEETKGGIAPDAVPGLASLFAPITNIRLDGFMTMPPPADDPEASRPAFEALRALRDRVEQSLGRALPVLSMGMSGDFEVAIACGATHVRIGTAIFGARS